MRRDGPEPMSQINVTPFVDVMLVLLVIFMVAAPLIQQGIDVQLPKTQSQGLRGGEAPLVITVKRDGSVFVQRKQVLLAKLEKKLAKIFESRGDRKVYLRADGRARYGTIARILATLRRAGAERIGMVTEPEA